MVKFWSEYSFGDKDGSRRFKEFLGDLEAAGGEVRADIKEQVLASGWGAVYHNGKNFAASKARHIETGEPASLAVHAKGNPAVTFDIGTLKRSKIRGSETLGTEAKEVLFLVLLQVAKDSKAFTTSDIQKVAETLNPNILAGYIGNIYGASNPAKLAEEIINKGSGILEAARCVQGFFDLGLTVAGYELHRESKLVRDLRVAGAKLSGLGKDKWNPSDVYLIKDPAKVNALLSLKDIMAFNGAYAELVEAGILIPVSLKADAKAAMGAISTKRYANIEGPVKFEPSQMDTIIQEMKAVQRKCRVPVLSSLNKDTKLGKGGGYKTVRDFLEDPEVQEQLAQNVSWSRCYPPVLKWLNALKGNIVETLAICILEALSASPQSVGFYLVTPEVAKWKAPEGVTVEVKALEFQINTTSALIHYSLVKEGKSSDRTAQIRSKGSIPQIITYDSVRGGGKSLTIA